MSARRLPHELWAQALDEYDGRVTDEMRARYRELLREHGHLVLSEGTYGTPLPCGYPKSETER